MSRRDSLWFYALGVEMAAAETPSSCAGISVLSSFGVACLPGSLWGWQALLWDFPWHLRPAFSFSICVLRLVHCPSSMEGTLCGKCLRISQK